MSAQKETLLNKIRKQFESKYRHYPDILEQLDLELEELSYKSKISKHDLDGIEARLLRAGQSNRGHNKSHSIDSPYRGNLEIPTEGDEDNTQPIQKIQHYRNKSSLQNENTPQNKSSAYKILKGRLSHTPGLTDNSLYYMSPMDIAVLKKGGLIDGENKYSGKKRINATFIEEFERSESPPQRVAKSFMADESIDMDQNNARSGKRLQPIVGVPNLPKTEKMVEREKMIKADVWHKIEDFRVQQFDNKEKQKAVENKKLTQKWLTDLQKQVQDNKMRKDKEKRRDLLAGIKHVESETALQQEHIDKEKRYKEYRSIFEKNSQLANVRARMEQAQLKQYEKNQDSFDIQKEQQRYEMVVGKDRRSQSRDAGPFERQMASREEEKPMKAWIQREEKERMMRKKYVEFLKEKGLYHQSSKNSAQEEHLRNRRKDISIDQANDSILKFMNADHHTEVGRNRMRRNLQNMNDMRQEQTIDKNMKEIIEMEHLKEQKTLWKAKEDQLEIREKLTREAEKLKKLVQKQALDAQIEQARALKRGPITDKEQRINRSILKLID